MSKHQSKALLAVLMGVFLFMPFARVRSTFASPYTPPHVQLLVPTVTGLQVTINGVTNVTAVGAYSWEIQWSWGDGTQTTGWFPQTHAYERPGTYTVTVTAVDSNGLEGSATTTVTAKAFGAQSNCRQDDPAVVQTGYNSTLHIISGFGNFSGVSPTNKSITVKSETWVSGTVTLEANNGIPSFAVVPLIGTLSWGDHSRAWWLIDGRIPTGNSTFTSRVEFKAPSLPGRYHVIFAFRGEMSGDQIASATNWSVGNDLWNDGNDLASLSDAKIAQAQRCGFTVENWLFKGSYQLTYVPTDAISILVKSQGQLGERRNLPITRKAWDARAVAKWIPYEYQASSCRQPNGNYSAACIAKLMKEHGDTPKSIDFFQQIRRRGDPGFLESFKHVGRIDLGVAVFPMRPNDNTESVFLNGEPSVIVVGFPEVTLLSNPLYPKIQRYYRTNSTNAFDRSADLSVSANGSAFERIRKLTGGAEGFIFEFPLVMGCHACGIPYEARAEFNFSGNGLWKGTRLLEPCFDTKVARVTHEKNIISDIPACR
ncbi:MAG: PKD domain-containing protein [Candidatus Eremiobacteraeota bacterium]|nr:PKD domain-containing protein [Candidatus Eremiobacteraeota bacterium]